MTVSDAALIGGRERRPIELVPYDAAWAAHYEALRLPLLAALVGVAVRVEHVGSTAVPELAAKPIVDVQVAVSDPDDEQRYGPFLERLGYRPRVREPGHRMFRTPALDVHVHVWRADGPDERRHLLFRDWLRRSRADRERYASVKRQLASREWEDMNAYADAKGPVIAEIMVRAERWAAETAWSLPEALA